MTTTTSGSSWSKSGCLHLLSFILTNVSFRRLSTDQLIKIVIGEEDSMPYYVPKSLLEGASECFTKAIKNQHLGDTTSGTLHFPEDGDMRKAWEFLLYWITKRELPPSYVKIEWFAEDQLLFVQAWVLADRYLLPQLQDVVMLELLWHFDATPLDKHIMTPALQLSPVDTPLRRLLAEEVVYLLHGLSADNINRIHPNDLLPSDGTVGLSASLVEAARRFQVVEKSFERRVFCEVDYWKEYMVAGGPGHHWIHTTDKAQARKEMKALLCAPAEDEV